MLTYITRKDLKDVHKTCRKGSEVGNCSRFPHFHRVCITSIYYLKKIFLKLTDSVYAAPTMNATKLIESLESQPPKRKGNVNLISQKLLLKIDLNYSPFREGGGKARPACRLSLNGERKPS